MWPVSSREDEVLYWKVRDFLYPERISDIVCNEETGRTLLARRTQRC